MEKLRVLDDKGNDVNKIIDREIVHEQGLWHREVAICVFNNKGDFLLQRRSEDKKIDPGKLSACAGHVEFTNSSIITAKNELHEEIGLDVEEKDIIFLTTEKKEKVFGPNLINRIFNDVYYVITDMKISDFKIQKEELSEVMWINYLEFKKRVLNNDSEITIKFTEPEEMKTFKLLDEIYCKITHN